MAKPRDPNKVCGGKTPNGPCQQWAGAGTTHKGIGACKRHGGATPNHQVAAERHMINERIRTYGSPVEIAPDAALIEEVHRSAGHVRWLEELVGNLTHNGSGWTMEIVVDKDGNDIEVFHPASGLKQMEVGGKFEKASVWVEMYQNERKLLARVCKMALDAGVAERQVRLAEAQGRLLADVIRGILGDLELSPEQQAEAPSIVRRHLTAVPA